MREEGRRDDSPRGEPRGEGPQAARSGMEPDETGDELGAAGEPDDREPVDELEVDASDLEQEAPELPPDVLAVLRDEGWGGAPFVEHEGLIVGNHEIYEVAERMGAADRIPRTSLAAVFAEAGLNIDEVAELPEPDNPSREFFEDYLRGLPRHIRDKYGI